MVTSESQIFNWPDVHASLVKKSIKVPMCLVEPSTYALIHGDGDDRLCSSYDSVLDAAAVAGVASTPRSRPAAVFFFMFLGTDRSSRGFLLLDPVVDIKVRCKLWTTA